MAQKRILVIEDNVDNLELVRFLLERAGFAVLSAQGGCSGLQVAREQLPDLVLLDLTLPEMDGWEVVDLLKKDPATAALPVVALTAHTLPGDRQRALDAGCDGYISKPLDVAGFALEIEGYLPSNG